MIQANTWPHRERHRNYFKARRLWLRGLIRSEGHTPVRFRMCTRRGRHGLGGWKLDHHRGYYKQ